MIRVRSVSLLAAGAVLLLALSGCAGGSTDPISEGGGAASTPATAQDERSQARADDASSVPAGWIGGEATTGLDWPAAWPVQFPRVGGEIIAAVSEPGEDRYSVVMYVEPGVAADLIGALEAQGMTVTSDDSAGDNDIAVFQDGSWRIDVIAVVQDGTERPHLRYMVQRD
ncbi:MAG TPA: hypothetical protein PLB94_06495 [Microbacteriaceae bacterium]|nr:hypothetical protein [Microbacteriaceae bacterium]HQZ48610.1 hypothetical protein [Microbacteriaceae bacterium]HRA09546.1 hypothetical protein [Microbacteriaceae bacterium]